ncbi:hypothetical protein GQ457_04G019340 [Hibiscus cannabinus]
MAKKVQCREEINDNVQKWSENTQRQRGDSILSRPKSHSDKRQMVYEVYGDIAYLLQVHVDKELLRAEWLKFWINPSTYFTEEWMEFLRRFKQLRDRARPYRREVPEEDSSSLPRKPQETCPCFVFSTGGLHSNVHNPTNLRGVSGSNLWASPIKMKVPNFNDPIEMKKLKEEQSKDFGAIDDKFKYLEESIKAMESTVAFIGTDAMKLSLVPDLILPPNFEVPKFEKFDDTSYPNTHLTMFCFKMTGYENDDKLFIHCFQNRLTGSAMQWYNQLRRTQVSTWRELARAFKEHYKHVLDMVLDRLTLQNIGKKDKESFREYVQRWRDIAA